MLIKRKIITNPIIKQKMLDCFLLSTNILAVDDVEILLEKDIENANCNIFIFVTATQQVLKVDAAKCSLEVLTF